MVSAYAAFANKGVYSKPIAITKIEDRYGNTIREYYPAQYEVLSEETAFLMTNLMQTVMDRGTGGSARWKYNFTFKHGEPAHGVFLNRENCVLLKENLHETIYKYKQGENDDRSIAYKN